VKKIQVLRKSECVFTYILADLTHKRSIGLTRLLQKGSPLKIIKVKYVSLDDTNPGKLWTFSSSEKYAQRYAKKKNFCNSAFQRNRASGKMVITNIIPPDNQLWEKFQLFPFENLSQSFPSI
jgi:hypothetical protein